METIIGTIQNMKVGGTTATGYTLEHAGGRVHLDREETLNELEIGQQVDVFIYPDKAGKLCASTMLPSATVDQFGWAEVAGIIKGLGAFVDISTTTEILCSSDEMPLFERAWPNTGDKLYVKLKKDRKNRLLAVPATEGDIDDMRASANDDIYGKTVSGYVYRTDREGTAIITDEKYRGFIHRDERKVEPRLGQHVEGRVIDIHDDGTLNVSLRPLKQDSMGEDADQILEHIDALGGTMPFTDKSDPEEIRATFHISKAAFKRALGKLMKERKIKQENGQTILVEATETEEQE